MPTEPTNPLIGLDPWDQALLDALEGSDSLSTLEELSESAGVSLPLLEALVRGGLLIPKASDPDRFDAAEAEAVSAGLQLVEAGLPLAELMNLAREMDDAMRPIAARAVDVFATFVRDSVEATAESDVDAAARLVEAFRTMLPATSRLVGHHFRGLLLAHARARMTQDR
ncbi:MAG TPA: hypothetical protein VMS74_15545 [Acidimicrobiia bacterium]|nr:hypothetical protein [Acidimicrobiia bacterium]